MVYSTYFVPSTLSCLSNPNVSFVPPGVESVPECGSHLRIQETIKQRHEKPLRKKEQIQSKTTILSKNNGNFRVKFDSLRIIQ